MFNESMYLANIWNRVKKTDDQKKTLELAYFVIPSIIWLYSWLFVEPSISLIVKEKSKPNKSLYHLQNMIII